MELPASPKPSAPLAHHFEANVMSHDDRFEVWPKPVVLPIAQKARHMSLAEIEAIMHRSNPKSQRGKKVALRFDNVRWDSQKFYVCNLESTLEKKADCSQFPSSTVVAF